MLQAEHVYIFAAMQDWAEGVRLIWNHNGELNTVDHRRQTALEAVTESGCQSLRQILLDAGADAVVKNASAQCTLTSNAKPDV